jgi:WD40 repeat protein
MYDVSRNGTLVYISREPAASYGFVEVTLDGEEHALDHVAGHFALPRYSPDGSRIAYEAIQTSGGAEARIFDLTTGGDRQFTSGGGSQPVWSADGEDLFYTQRATGYRRPADASEGATRLFTFGLAPFFNDVHPDGSALLWDFLGFDLYVQRPGAEEPEALVVGEGFAGHARFSPDGRWVAYTADQDGELRVYANSFPEFDSPRSVSPGFAVDPVWSPDGRSIFYRSGDRFFSIAIRTEPTLAASGSPRELFRRPGFVPRGSFRNWDLHPDGDRFLMLVAEGIDSEAPFNAFFVTSWFEELRERVPTR